MKRISFASLRVRLILLVLIAAIPALGITLYSGLEYRNHTRNHALDDALRLVQEISKDHDHLIQNARHILFTLSKISQVQQQDKAACCKIFAEIMKQSEGYTALVAAKPNGDVFGSSLPITHPVNFADRPWFQRLLKTRAFVIGEYQIGRISGKPSIVLAYPVLDDIGNLKAILSLGMDLDWLNQLVVKSKLPEGTSVTVFDNEGTILFRYPEPEKFVGKSIPEVPIVKVILTKREGAEETVGLGGVPRLFGFTSLGKGVESVHVSVGIPRKIALAKVDGIMKQSLAYLGLITLLALASAWFIGGLFVIHPVNRLLDMTKRLTDGDLNARVGPSYGRGEIDKLGSAFDQMGESLQHREAERKRAEEALQRSEKAAKQLSEENSIMAEISRIISSTLNIDEVYERFAEEVHKLISFDRIAINIINSQDQTFTVAYITGVEIEDRRQGDVIPLAGSATKEAVLIRKGSIIQIADGHEITARSSTYLPSFRAGLRSMMTIPLIFKDQVIGIVHLQSIKPNAYTERDLRIAERVGHQIAGAIANARLFIERKRAEEEYKTILHTAMDGFWITDMQGRFLDVNDAYCRLIGYSRDEMLTMRIPDVEAAERPEETAQHIKKIMEVGGDRFETCHRCKGGRIVDVEISVNYIDAGGGRLFVFARDITERKRSEEALRRAGENFHRSLDESPLGVRIVTTEGETVYANRAILEIYGYDSIEELRTTPVKKRYTPESYAEFQIRKEKRGRGEYSPPEYEISIVRKNGEVRYLRVFRKEVLWNDERQFQVIYLDITERKWAEEALQESKELFEKTFISQLDAIFLLDAINPPTILHCNPAATEVFGYTRQEMVGRTTDFLHVNETALKEFQRHLYPTTDERGFMHLFEFRMKRKDGTVFPTEHSATPLEDEQGKRIGWVSVVRDITEAKQAQKELIERGMFNFALFHYNPIQTIAVDLEGKVTVFNLAKEKSGDRLPNIGDVMYKDYARGHEIDMYGEMMKCIRSRETKEFPEQKYGEKVLSITISPFAKGAIIISQDITERKRAEENILTYQGQLRSLASELSLIEERERRRIATELHDHISQTLAIAKIKLGMTQGLTSSTDWVGSLNEIGELIDQAIQYTRSLTFELSPPILYELGLEAGIEWLTEQIQEKHGIQIGFEDDQQPKPMNEEIRLTLFKATRELLINTVKHAQASKAKVSIWREDNSIRIRVEDDGVGFSTSEGKQLVKTIGFGLFNIRERIKYLGGDMVIESEPGRGTRVTLSAPLEEKED